MEPGKGIVCGFYTDWARWDGSESYGAVGWYRIINPIKKLGGNIQGKFSLLKPEDYYDLKKKGDVWIFKQVDNPAFNIQLGTAKVLCDARLIMDLDDDPFSVDKKHPAYEKLKEVSHTQYKLIKEADHIIVSTEPLKQAISEINPYITVIPNAIDPEIWKVKRKKKRKRVRIGWVASGSHMSDLPMIMPVLKELHAKYSQVEIILAGIVDKEMKGDRIFHYEGTPGYAEYPQFLADLNLDIAIAPLEDTKFNRAKSNIKWLENSMLKTPMVLSDVYPYSNSVTHGKDGYLVKGHNQWIKHLTWLIESPEKRKEIGEAAYKKTLENWTIDKFLPKYREVIERVRKKNITVYTAVTGEFDKLRDDQNTAGADFVAFTRQKSTVWNIQKPYDKFKDERRNSRIQKIMPHLFFDTEYSIYLDGNIALTVPAQKLIDEFLKDKDVAVFRHIGRDCVYDEADACVAMGKETPEELSAQIREYARRGIKKHAGLAECGVIIRRNTSEVANWNEKWWAEYSRYGCRDQISFPVAFPLDKVNLIESSAWRHPYFSFKNHA